MTLLFFCMWVMVASLQLIHLVVVVPQVALASSSLEGATAGLDLVHHMTRKYGGGGGGAPAPEDEHEEELTVTGENDDGDLMMMGSLFAQSAEERMILHRYGEAPVPTTIPSTTMHTSVSWFRALEIAGVCALIVAVVAATSSCAVVVLRLFTNAVRGVLRDQRRRRRRRQRAALQAAIFALSNSTPTESTTTTTNNNVPPSSPSPTWRFWDDSIVNDTGDTSSDDEPDFLDDGRRIPNPWRTATSQHHSRSHSHHPQRTPHPPPMSARRVSTNRQWIRRAVSVVTYAPPTRPPSTTKKGDDDEEEEESSRVVEEIVCPICLDDMLQGQRVCILPCKHEMHTHCAWPWLIRQPSCPVCRRGLSPMDQQEEARSPPSSHHHHHHHNASSRPVPRRYTSIE